jgi:hypothetical protein
MPTIYFYNLFLVAAEEKIVWMFYNFINPPWLEFRLFPIHYYKPSSNEHHVVNSLGTLNVFSSGHQKVGGHLERL